MTDMNSGVRSAPRAALEEDSPVTVLQHLEQERGRLFSEAEYRELRRVVLEELSFGARLRPFTIFTFVVVELGLAGLLAVGLVTSAHHDWGDSALAWMSGAALLSGGGFFWFLWEGIRKDRLRTLEERLGELEELQRHALINAEEYQQLRSHILHQRQRSGRV
jgi:hypothetical protein